MLDFFQSVDMNLIKWIHQYFSNTLFDIFMPFITNKKNWTLPIIVLIFLLGFFPDLKGK
ncbi:MAG: hypothetical protein CM15mP44_1640 [Candidatus Neomarinimicrobiota bacterium]|nr:MAG: hypothetical protein CM15mP44_1640 [Candidatus Neomarinimicrobiota bacterium]